MIRLDQCRIGYSSPIVTSQRLELSAGEVYVLTGRNGAGKSTLLKTITREVALLSGEILVDHKPLNQISRAELPRYISFVTAHFPPIDFLRTEEYIGLGRSPYTNFIGKLSEEDHRIVEQVIEQLGIQHLVGRFTSALSDGEKQLVAIAKAIAQESTCILLDEPTAFLDYSNKIHVIQLLLDVAKSLNKCIIFSSHDLELCLDNVSQFLVINDQTAELEILTSPDRKTLIAHAFSL